MLINVRLSCNVKGVWKHNLLKHANPKRIPLRFSNYIMRLHVSFFIRSIIIGFKCKNMLKKSGWWLLHL